MTSPQYQWVTIARFWAPGHALFFKSVLEGNGIPAFVKNEYLGGLFAHLSLMKAEGGIELQVPSDLVEEAASILEGLETDVEGMEAGEEEEQQEKEDDRGE